MRTPSKLEPTQNDRPINTLRTIEKVTKLSKAIVRAVCFAPLARHLQCEFSLEVDARNIDKIMEKSERLKQRQSIVVPHVRQQHLQRTAGDTLHERAMVM